MEKNEDHYTSDSDSLSFISSEEDMEKEVDVIKTDIKNDIKTDDKESKSDKKKKKLKVKCVVATEDITKRFELPATCIRVSEDTSINLEMTTFVKNKQELNFPVCSINRYEKNSYSNGIWRGQPKLTFRIGCTQLENYIKAMEKVYERFLTSKVENDIPDISLVQKEIEKPPSEDAIKSEIRMQKRLEEYKKKQDNTLEDPIMKKKTRKRKRV